jgi:Xaa-Pro aminopeptidase
MTTGGNMSALERRQDRLVEALAGRGLSALLVSDLTNVRYLTGFVGTNALVGLGPERRQLFTDSRYMVAARAQTSGVEIVDAGRELLDRVAQALRESAGDGPVGVEAENLTLARHERLKAALNGVALEPTAGLVESLRARKEPSELALMREAAAIGDRAFEAVASRPLAGRLERDVAWELEGVLREHGAEGPSFPIIVAGGPRSALPHAVPGAEPIPAGSLVVVDLGAIRDGYASDCTRTFAAAGAPLPEELERAYAVCLEAQLAALARVAPGVEAAELDAVARGVIESAGLGGAFGHGLGHGVGLDIHERPWVRPNAPGKLEEGMVVTVEPGIYLEGVGGVRIEDLVVVTADAGEVLTRFPKELTVL